MDFHSGSGTFLSPNTFLKWKQNTTDGFPKKEKKHLRKQNRKCRPHLGLHVGIIIQTIVLIFECIFLGDTTTVWEISKAVLVRKKEEKTTIRLLCQEVPGWEVWICCWYFHTLLTVTQLFMCFVFSVSFCMCNKVCLFEKLVQCLSLVLDFIL